MPKEAICMTESQRTPDELARACSDAMFSRDRATQAMGARLLDSGPGRARLSMQVRADMIQGHGTCHGGYLFALADSAFAFACNSYDEATVTQGCSIDYLAPAVEHDVLTATASELSRKGRTGLYDVRLENQRGELIALFRGKSYKVRGTVLAQESKDD
jgi:acyl-CoA thioesterase